MRREKVSSVLLSVVIVAAAIFSNAALTSGTPDRWIPGIVEDYVYVYRDDWGVPHIYGQSVSDAYFAFGYVMAEDRLFQMDLFRRSVAGRTAEILGSEAFAQDLLMKTLGVYQIAVDTWNGLYPGNIVPTDVKENLQQFSNGVNRYIADMKIPDDIPTEYRALSFSTGIPLPYFIPYAWTPPDSLAIAGMMGLMLTDTSEGEIIKGAYMAMVDPVFEAQGLPGLSDFLMPIEWVNATTISFPDPPLTKVGPIEPITAPLQRTFRSAGGLWGSNNWVISAANTTTGNAMLANDPHLDLQTPGINWQVHINVPSWANVTGCCIPGGPVIYTGHNDYFAFGVTNLMADVMDLYYYDPTNGTHYWYVDHWEPFNIGSAVVYNFTQPIPIPVVSTRHGPLITTPLPPPFDKMAVRWAGKETGYGEVTGFSLLMNATSIAEWKQALSHQCVIIQNYVYADKDGNIAWCPSGKIPLRPPPPPAGTGTLGVAPSNGSAGQNEWMGWLPHATAPIDYPFDPWPGPVSMPCIENPPQGFIATSNNQPIGPGHFGYPWPIWIGPAFGFAPGYRGERITELIKALNPISVDDMKAIQADSVSIPARNMVPILVGVMAGDSNTTIQNALAILTTWNASEMRNLVAPLIWEVFLEKFADNTFSDEFGPYGLYPFPNMIISLWNMTQTWMWNPYAITLFDNKVTPSAGPGQPGWEFMPTIMNQSLHDALDWIATQLGPPADSAFSNWKYGNLHVVDFGHPMGSLLPGFNVPHPAVGCDGGPYTVDPGGFTHAVASPEVLHVSSGASYRGIYECKEDWATSLILVPPGESGSIKGHPLGPLFNPHYRDTFEMWLNNQYTPCLIDDTIIQTYPRTTFYPAIHNIAVIEVVPPAEGVPTGLINVDVEVKNEGLTAENVTLTLSYDSNPISTQTIINLASGATALLTFLWDTTSLPADMYVLQAEASPVPGEIYLDDNSKEATVNVGPPAEMRVDPATVQIQLLNKTFTLNVTLNNLWEGWRTVAVQFRLCYNDTLLEVVDVTQGEFLQDPTWNLYGTFFTHLILDDPTYGPNILVGILLYPNATGHWNDFPHGDGALATITFKGIYQERGLEKPPQTCPLQIADPLIVDDQTIEIPLSTVDGLYEMHPTHIGDFNYDGQVDIWDVATAAAAFGSFPGHERWNPLCDTNNDGKIDIKDLAVAAAGFGWTPTYDP